MTLKINIKKFIIALVGIVALTAHARVIEMVLPYAPGGTADKLGQTILPLLRSELAKNNVSVVVTFKPGGGTTIGANAVAKTEPGKIQMLLISNSIVQAPIVNNLSDIYDINRDFHIVGYLGHMPMIMVVNTDTNIQNFSEFRNQCRQGKLSYGTGGIGTSGHISSAIISGHAGCNSPAGHFKGMGPMLVSLVGNHVNYGTDYPSSVKPLIDSNKLRPILVFDRQRLAAYPDVPTIKEVGIDVQLENWFIIAVNSTASAEDLALVQNAVAQVLTNQSLVDQLRDLGFKNINAKIPTKFLVAEQNNFVKLIKNIKLDVK